MHEALDSTLKRVLWWATLCLLSLVFLVHFSLVQLSNMPLSPLKLGISEVVDGYVNPFFSQRWSFFAPQPIEHDTTVVIRGRYLDPSTGKAVITPWLDVTTPLLDAVREDRLTPIFLVELGLSNVVIDLESRAVADPRASFQKDGKKYLREKISPEVSPVDVLLMTRTALASLEASMPDRKFEAVQLGLAHYDYPRFTQRHSSSAKPGPLPMTLIDWQPASKVAPFASGFKKRG
jgi:hypothetical protein